MVVSDGIMKKVFSWWSFLIFILMSGAIGFGASRWLHLNFWLCLAITAGSVFLIGILAIIEDWMQGGFHNPNKGPDNKE